MPELAAHLERVVQLEQLSTLDVPDHNGHMVQWVRKKEVRPILAAALAACAREVRIEAHNEAVAIAAQAFVDYIAPKHFMKVAQAMEIAEEIRALERAVGEKA